MYLINLLTAPPFIGRITQLLGDIKGWIPGLMISILVVCFLAIFLRGIIFNDDHTQAQVKKVSIRVIAYTLLIGSVSWIASWIWGTPTP